MERNPWLYRFCRCGSISLLMTWSLIFSPSATLSLQHLHTNNKNSETRRDAFEEISKFSMLLPLSISVSTITMIRPFVEPTSALTPKEAAIVYDSYAESYDELDGGNAANILGLDVARSNLFRQARGSVLEIGVGTGLNLDKYDLEKLESLTLVDVSEGMLKETKKRIQSIPSLRNNIPVKFIQADATSQLIDRFGKESFDTVVDSFSFCVMGTKGAKDCLKQIQQVVKTKRNNGKILLLENNRSSNFLVGLYQDATAEAAASAGGKGCIYNQDVTKLLQATDGIEIIEEHLYASGIFRSYKCETT